MSTSSPRPDPVIPDHEVLRKVGGGAYGEVWLARGVTGALRAVKVVWREDFDDERSFEREFEGILKFEPISRDHPGMVNILHVGRSPDQQSFYYYVMELGDDVISGRDINPIEYEARTLRSDIKRTPGRRLATDFCIDVGVRLAEALRHLHDNGLAHRDVKPANVIFVAGKAKLADIGLVATRGQRTFVGTEGFVPPEGPGSAQADVYSLGKVLYEIASGKDRMDFPELPDELPAGPERKRWQALNQIICDVCEPQLSKRRISTAGDLADALRWLQEGKRRRRRRPVGALIATLLVSAVLVFGAWESFKGSAWNAIVDNFITGTDGPAQKEQVKERWGSIKILTNSPGAKVYDESGRLPVSDTPTEALSVPVGKPVTFRIEKVGFRTEHLSFVVPESAATETEIKTVELKVDAPPKPALTWQDHLGQRYRPLENGHESDKYVGAEEWEKYRAEKQPPADVAEFVEVDEGNNSKRKIALTSRGEAQAFCYWLATKGIEGGYLTDQYDVSPLIDEGFNHPAMSERARKEGLRPFRCWVETIDFATIRLDTDPAGAEVFVKASDATFNYSKGKTDGTLVIDDLKPGKTELLVVLEGYKPLTQEVTLSPGQDLPLKLKLQVNNSVVMERPWENGLGMRFVPVPGRELMASIWETRVKDYDAYLADPEAGGVRYPPEGLVQGPDHPVVNVSREDAERFCKWLTAREIKQERISSVHVYRLPTDLEWSLLADTIEDPEASPAKREQQIEKVFPWGTEWPPPQLPDKVGNFADSMATKMPGISSDRIITGYNDGFEATAPVGTFAPNKLGLFDLAGNVNEWVSDDYSTISLTRYGVLRGGAWNTYLKANLYTGYRNPQPKDVRGMEFRDILSGFRIVLAKDTPKPETAPTEINNDDNG